MCGIFGGYSNNLPEGYSSKAINLLKHRGPDGSGFVQKGNYFLGHTRLAIQDVSELGAQPMHSSCGKAIITFNGEIYNVSELREDLISKGFVLNGNSDTEVLVNLYSAYGYDLLEKINGIFAFAIYDLEKDNFFLARDGYGVKPLFFSSCEKKFFFSSELKVLLLDPEFNKTINLESIARHLTFLWNPYPNTMFEHISKLEPGYAAVFKKSSLEKKWRFDNRVTSFQVNNLSIDDAVNSTRFLIEQAVKKQMISDVPIGAFLSGGLDSSSIVHFAKENHLGGNLKTFTIDTSNYDMTSDGNVSDLPYAKLFAKHAEVDLKVVELKSNVVENLEKMIYHLEEPIADIAPLNVMAISELASSNNIKVLLSGAGGDDIFSGYRRHVALEFEKYWSWLPLFLRKNMSKLSKLSPHSNHLIRRLSKALKYSDFDRDLRLVSYFYWLDPEIVLKLIGENFQKNLNIQSITSPLFNRIEELSTNTEALNKMLFLEQSHFLSDHNLAYTDKLGMAYGVEIRVPFLENDLISFASSLPTNYKQRGRTSKWILKKAMQGIIPDNIIFRKKTGFGGPLRYWMKNDLKEYSNDLLSSQRFQNRGYFDYEKIIKLRNKDLKGRIDASYSIFSLLCMEIWFRNFTDVDFSKQ